MSDEHCVLVSFDRNFVVLVSTKTLFPCNNDIYCFVFLGLISSSSDFFFALCEVAHCVRRLNAYFRRHEMSDTSNTTQSSIEHFETTICAGGIDITEEMRPRCNGTLTLL